MKKLKMIISLVLVAALTAGLAITGTLAYLTDRESKANVFTVGNVSIRLDEDFDQGAELIPGVDIEKKPTITNTGKNDAWVWAEIAIPTELNSIDSAAKNIIHFNMSAASVADGLWNWWDGEDYSEGTYLIDKKEINGVSYDVYTVQYETALKPGETTAEPLIYKVYMDTHVDIDPDGNWAWVENGEVSPINWNVNENGYPVIYVNAYAMQTDGFETVYDAYDAYQTQWGDNGSEYAEPIDPSKLIKTVEDLRKAVTVGGEGYILYRDLEVTDWLEGGNNYKDAFIVTADTSLDLNGHTIFWTYGEAEPNTDKYLGTLFYVNGVTLDITGDGKIDTNNTQWIHASNGAEVNIYGGEWVCEFVNTEGMYASKNSVINVYDGSFDFGSDGPDSNVNNYCLIYNLQNDGTASAINLYGGTHQYFNESFLNGHNDGYRRFLPEGYTVVESTDANGYNWYTVVPGGSVSLENGETFRVENTAEPLTISGNGTVVLSNAVITAAEGNALTVAAGATVELVIEGENTLKGAEGYNGIYSEGDLTITGNGKLTAIGGNGQDSDKGGSGIAAAGKISIDGLSDLVAEGWGKAGFGIGGESKNIEISNTTISSVKGGYVQQNCAEGDLWDKNSPEGAPAIGSLTDDAVITLKNVTIEKAEGGGKSAGIGARYWTGVTVNIEDSIIEYVVGGTGSAGIGGSHPSKNDAADKDITITITNSTINAYGGQYGAGIGSGYDTYCHSEDKAPMTTVTIDAASKITAVGGKLGAGIGTGHNAINFKGYIDCDTSNVKADTSKDECCLGADCTVAENVGLGALKKEAFGLK